MPQVNRTCLIIIPIVLCFTLVVPNIIYASDRGYCREAVNEEGNCIFDLGAHIAGKIASNIDTYGDLYDNAGNVAKEIIPTIYSLQEGVGASDVNEFIGSENYEEALKVVLEDYTKKSNVIRDTLAALENLGKTVTATKALYNVVSGANCSDVAGCVSVDSLEPNMSEMENFLGVAKLNCSGGSPASINNALTRVVGVQGLGAFNAKRATVCEAIEKIYHLKYKLQQLQSIRLEGYRLLYKHDEKLIKKAGRRRTVEHSIDLRYYPDIQKTDDGNFFPEISLNNDTSYFKWSKNEPVYLAEILNSDDAKEAGEDCDGHIGWIPLAPRLKFRLKMLDASASECTLIACLRIRFRGKNHDRKLAHVEIPAPFGVLDELTQMKDAAVQKAMHSLQNQIAEMLGINDKLDAIATKLDAIPTKSENSTMTR